MSTKTSITSFFFPELVICISCIWSFLRTCQTVVENRSIHRNREEKHRVGSNLRKNEERDQQDVHQSFINSGKDTISIRNLKHKYQGIPMIKAVSSFWFSIFMFLVTLNLQLRVLSK